MHQTPHIPPTAVTGALNDTYTLLTLALLSTECHTLEEGQVTQLGNVQGGEDCIFKAAREQRSDVFRSNKNSRKGQVSLTQHPGDSPGPLSIPAAGMHSEDILIQLVPVVLNSRV